MVGLRAACISNSFVFDNRVDWRGSTPPYYPPISLKGGQPLPVSPCYSTQGHGKTIHGCGEMVWVTPILHQGNRKGSDQERAMTKRH